MLYFSYGEITESQLMPLTKIGGKQALDSSCPQFSASCVLLSEQDICLTMQLLNFSPLSIKPLWPEPRGKVERATGYALHDKIHHYHSFTNGERLKSAIY